MRKKKKLNKKIVSYPRKNIPFDAVQSDWVEAQLEYHKPAARGLDEAEFRRLFEKLSRFQLLTGNLSKRDKSLQGELWKEVYEKLKGSPFSLTPKTKQMKYARRPDVIKKLISCSFCGVVIREDRLAKHIAKAHPLQNTTSIEIKSSQFDVNNEVLAESDIDEISLRIVEKLNRESSFSFDWPTTDAPAGIHGLLGDQYWFKKGLLAYVGYIVGKTYGKPKVVRLQLLDYVLFNDLPRVVSLEYMNEWGKPETTLRLKKLANTLAALTRNAKRNNLSGYRFAIEDWESDLLYLYDSYYSQKLQFNWPETIV